MRPSQTNPPVYPSRPESLLEEDRDIIRTHKIPLRPTRRQYRLLEQHARFAYNWTLRYFKDRHIAGEAYPTSMLFPVWAQLQHSCPEVPNRPSL